MTTLSVMTIYHDSICDGEGLRSVVFLAGCPHHCKGCHNPESWNMRNGKEMSVDDILAELKANPLTDVTLSGGEPFLQEEAVLELVKRIKAETDKTIWSWSGWTFEELKTYPIKAEILRYIDVLVDGRFIVEQRDTKLKWRGSPNQRVLKLENGEVVEQLY